MTLQRSPLIARSTENRPAPLNSSDSEAASNASAYS